MGVPPRMSTPPSSEVTAVSVSGASTVSEGAAVSSVYSAGAVMAGLVFVSGLRVPTKCNARAQSSTGWDSASGTGASASYKPFTG